MKILTQHAILDELALICPQRVDGEWRTHDASLLYSPDLTDAVLALFPDDSHANRPLASPSRKGIGYIYRECRDTFPPSTWRVIPCNYQPIAHKETE